jgi:hypothetical protein
MDTHDQNTDQDLETLTIAAARTCLLMMKGVEALPSNVSTSGRAEILLRASEALHKLMSCEPLAEVIKSALAKPGFMAAGPPRR